MTRILVCGGREFSDRLLLDKTLDGLQGQYGPYIHIIEGGARGADALAERWAKEIGKIVPSHVTHKQYPADWEKHGKRAGFIRNQQMLDEGKPDVVVAFPGGNGTADMVRRAKKAGVETIEVEYVPGREVTSDTVG